MKRYSKEAKYIAIALSLLVFITFVPNAMLRNWVFILFVFVDFYVTTMLLKRKRHQPLVLDSVLIGMITVAIAAIMLNMLGF